MILFYLSGDAFLSLSQDIEMAYKEYLANYNNITALENSYKQKEALWVEMVRSIKSSAWVRKPQPTEVEHEFNRVESRMSS